MKKKILGLLVALCLIIGMLPMAVLADPATLTIGQPATYVYGTGATNGYYLDGSNQIPFGPAAFGYALSGNTDANWQDSLSPRFVLNPGDPAKYFTTTASDSANVVVGLHHVALTRDYEQARFVCANHHRFEFSARLIPTPLFCKFHRASLQVARVFVEHRLESLA